ncbi:MAG: hypothetical protein IJA58_01200 [Lachnospiraceae bacterium]|nr:hypothetical protein [Lachnospiraceae bacterium]
MKGIKKTLAVILSLLLVVAIFGGDTIRANAEAPYYTWTQGPGGHVVHTQTAYEPGETIRPGLDNPEDFYVYQNKIYIADTGNERIVVLENNEIVQEITSDEMWSPTGIAVNDEYIYVADYDNACVLIFEHDGSLVRRIDKPTEKTLGENTKFAPMKIGVDMRGNIYVVSEGSYSGLMQISEEGNFLGYFGANRTNTSFMMILQKMFFTQEQIDKLFKNTPSSPANIAVDSMGLIYTVTQGASASSQGQSIRKLSISGTDLFSTGVNSTTFVDVAVDKNMNVFALDADGTFYEYDNYGNLVFAFGGKDTETQRVGLLSSPIAIDVLDNGNLIALDKTKGIIQVYAITDFAAAVHQGNALYLDGRYEESEKTWEYINKMNTAFKFSYEALGKAAFKRQDYQEAMEFYQMAENVTGYSQAFWYSRNDWIENNLGTVIIILAILWLVSFIVKKVDKKKVISTSVGKMKESITSIKIIDELMLMKMILKKPFDAYYEIRYQNKVGWLSATLLYIWLGVLQITNLYVTSYIFNQTNVAYVNVVTLVGSVLLPLLLFVVCNYLVSTITEGEGKFKHVYCGTIYAISPYLLFMLPLQILTNVLTQNEAFVYTFGVLVLVAWSAILVYLMIQEIHFFSFKGTVKNILVTAVTMFLLVLAAFMLYLLFTQLKDFIVDIIQEVRIRV